ncbi:dipeptidase [Verrucomicrobiota bacterium sgz303538]
MTPSFVFDAHLDLAMNAIEWNRDLRQPVAELRQRESRLRDKPDRGKGTVAFPEMRHGGVGICVATQLARVDHDAYSPIFGWRSQAQAWAMTQGQLAWYKAMEEAGEMVQLQTRADLEKHLSLWFDDSVEQEKKPIGYILSLEGADSLPSPAYLERAFGYGLRAIGPAHYGPGVYAFGTDSDGGLNEKGKELLREINRLGLILDVTHLCDQCFWEALDLVSGPIWASHQNCRTLVPHMRQFSDEQIRAIVDRGGVIGCALDAWMLVPGWQRGVTTPQQTGVGLQHVADHIDHICQLAGNARHVGLGSDLDGCFGIEQTPVDLDTIADLQKLAGILTTRGYSADDVEGICWRNFVGFLRRVWK